MLDPDADSAKGLMIAAIIVQVLFVVIWLFVLLIFLFAFPFTQMTTTPTTGSTPNFLFPYFGISVLFTTYFGAGILWIILDYFLIYQRLSEGRVPEAETPALVLGILQIVAGGVVPGILVIVAYIKIRDSLRNAQYRSQQQFPFQQRPPGY